LEKLLVHLTPLTSSHGSSVRCGVLIDGQYHEPQSGHGKITYECACLDEKSQDIVWGFVLSDDRHESAPTPKPKESPPPQVRRPVVAPRVAMHRQTAPVSPPSDFGAEVKDPLLSEEPPSLSPPPLSPLWFDMNSVDLLGTFYSLDNMDAFPSLIGQSIAPFPFVECRLSG